MAHPDEEETWPQIPAVLDTIELLLLKIAIYIKLLNREYVMV